MFGAWVSLYYNRYKRWLTLASFIIKVTQVANDGEYFFVFRVFRMHISPEKNAYATDIIVIQFALLFSIPFDESACREIVYLYYT